VIQEIVNECNKTRCKMKILPGISDLINEKVSISKLRDVDIEISSAETGPGKSERDQRLSGGKDRSCHRRRRIHRIGAVPADRPVQAEKAYCAGHL
jgi:hypothetical protein